MSVRWETEGLQTVGIVCLVIMFLKLMHLLGLIDITETGETSWDRRRSGVMEGQGKDERRRKNTLISLKATTQKFAESICEPEVSSCKKSKLLSKKVNDFLLCLCSLSWLFS